MQIQRRKRFYMMSLALIASIGGFLFGFDTAVISGTIGFVKNQFGLNALQEGWYVSSALLGSLEEIEHYWITRKQVNK